MAKPDDLRIAFIVLLVIICSSAFVQIAFNITTVDNKYEEGRIVTIKLDSGQYKTQEEIDAKIRQIDQLGANMIALTVGGELTYYPSEVSHGQIPISDFTYDFDLLEYFIQKGKEKGLKVYAVVDLWIDYSSRTGNEAYSEWWVVDRHGNPVTSRISWVKYWFSPAIPEVREFYLSIIEEMLAKGVDGIMLDFVRYLDQPSYDSYSLEQFTETYGISPLDFHESDTQMWAKWETFMTETITNFVKEASKIVHSKFKYIGCYVFSRPNIHGTDVNGIFQGWNTWDNLVDFFNVMEYGNLKTFQETVTYLRNIDLRSPTYLPIVPEDINIMKQKLESVRLSADGVSIYNFESLSGNSYQFLKEKFESKVLLPHTRLVQVLKIGALLNIVLICFVTIYPLYKKTPIIKIAMNLFILILPIIGLLAFAYLYFL
ncbi:family 10 glycosylhydrolase [Candidatus Borrarchaeum sp.]|uniref:family 10 glycosylhydrolase n=1 Tax=Candidatus Borrarchaeum sp. TaxID=2846742 RepID=UPI002579954A|nr:family 10 glycosylhydrolase [Candidatus Borrarchaeum sp.]